MLLFLMKTKNNDVFCEKIRQQDGMDGATYVELREEWHTYLLYGGKKKWRACII